MGGQGHTRTRDDASHRRRRLLRAAASLPLASLAAACGGGGAMGMFGALPGAGSTPLPGGGPQTLARMALIDGQLDGHGVREFSLVAAAGTSRMFAGIATRTLGYNGPLLGPALRLRQGERTRIRVRNHLAEATTVHWHGLLVPAEVDGGPHQPIAPGEDWTAEFTVANPQSTCWFHPHPHGRTGHQVAAGLAGLLVVEDADSGSTGLPSSWGVDDMAVVLQDKRFSADGQIDYALTAGDHTLGYRGDLLLANGTPNAVWDAPAQWVRLRLLNGCNARSLSLRLSDGAPLLQVANEGGLLPAPLARAALVLAPGERVEVLVDLSARPPGAELQLLARGVDAGVGMGMAMPDVLVDRELPALTMRAAQSRQAGAIVAPPTRLPVSDFPVAAAGAVRRSITLDGGMMGLPFTLNGASFRLPRVDFVARAGSVEVWRFTNHTMMAHPMHVHGVRMAMLSRDGGAPPPQERGLRDTFVVDVMQTVEMAVETAAVPSAVPLVFHCHILEHEDAGMMGQFATV